MSIFLKSQNNESPNFSKSGHIFGKVQIVIICENLSKVSKSPKFRKSQKVFMTVKIFEKYIFWNSSNFSKSRFLKSQINLELKIS